MLVLSSTNGIVFILMIIVIIRELLFWGNILQIKQYRFDRLQQFVQTGEYKPLFKHWFRLSIYATLLGSALLPKIITLTLFLVITILYCGQGALLLSSGALQAPKMTKKMTGMLLIVAVILLACFYVYPSLISALTLIALTPLALFLFFTMLQLPNQVAFYFLRQKAPLIVPH